MDFKVKKFTTIILILTSILINPSIGQVSTYTNDLPWLELEGITKTKHIDNKISFIIEFKDQKDRNFEEYYEEYPENLMINIDILDEDGFLIDEIDKPFNEFVEVYGGDTSNEVMKIYCRFNYPKPPAPFTMIVQPLVDTDSKKRDKKKSY